MNHQRINRPTEIRYFEKLMKLVHPEGLRCPHCGAQEGLRACRRHSESWIPDYRCPHCSCVFNAWTGTPFQGTHHPPSKLWCIIMQIKEGIFTTEIARRCPLNRGFEEKVRH
jgi:transposase-like protein